MDYIIRYNAYLNCITKEIEFHIRGEVVDTILKLERENAKTQISLVKVLWKHE
mgnify:CR=1 FL=1